MLQMLVHAKDIALLVLLVWLLIKLRRSRIESIRLGWDGVTARLQDMVSSAVERSQAIALASHAKLRRDLAEIGNLALGGGLRSQVLLETIAAGVDDLEAKFDAATGIEKLAYGTALLDAYELYRVQAREHWSSSDAYQQVWRRILDGQARTIAVCNAISGLQVDASGAAAREIAARAATRS